MSWQELKGLKFYIIFSVAVLGFFVYSGYTGWKWYNATETHANPGMQRGGYIHRYHK